MRTIKIDGDGRNTVTRDAGTFHPVHGIKSIRYEHAAGDQLPIAVVEVFAPQISAAVDGQFTMICPIDGVLKAVKRIEFVDGSSFEG